LCTRLGTGAHRTSQLLSLPFHLEGLSVFRSGRSFPARLPLLFPVCRRPYGLPLPLEVVHSPKPTLEVITSAIIRDMITSRNRKWRIGERRPTGPDLIYYLAYSFEKREDAEKKKDELAALPEKQGYTLGVTLCPEGDRGSSGGKRRRGSPGRARRRRDHR
jgi:hypothetical protein